MTGPSLYDSLHRIDVQLLVLVLHPEEDRRWSDEIRALWSGQGTGAELDGAFERRNARYRVLLGELEEAPTLDQVSTLLAHSALVLREVGMRLVERLPLAFERPFLEVGNRPVPPGAAGPVPRPPCATPRRPPRTA